MRNENAMNLYNTSNRNRNGRFTNFKLERWEIYLHTTYLPTYISRNVMVTYEDHRGENEIYS